MPPRPPLSRCDPARLARCPNTATPSTTAPNTATPSTTAFDTALIRRSRHGASHEQHCHCGSAITAMKSVHCGCSPWGGCTERKRCSSGYGMRYPLGLAAFALPRPLVRAPMAGIRRRLPSGRFRTVQRGCWRRRRRRHARCPPTGTFRAKRPATHPDGVSLATSLVAPQEYTGCCARPGRYT